MEKALTILLHGLYMNQWHMRALDKKIRAVGFKTFRYNYATIRQPIAQHSQQLHHWLCQHHNNQEPINLVGHSLGGLVIRDFLVRYPQWKINACVSMGTPHQGSLCGGFVYKYFKPLVKKAYQGALDGNLAPLPQGVKFGVIAGNRALGLGVPVLSYHSRKHQLNTQQSANDGTVFLSETILDDASDYLVLPVSHSQFLIDKTTAEQVIHFLEYGKFRWDDSYTKA